MFRKLAFVSLLSFVGVGAFAGQISWSATQILHSPSIEAYDPGSTKYTAYLYVGDAALLSTVKSYFSNGDITSASSAAAQAVTKTASSENPPKMNFMLNKYGSFVSTTVEAFLIITDSELLKDASYFMVAQNASGDEVLSGTFGTSGNVTYAWGDQSTNPTGWQQIGQVPEPATMSLLLVGLAGIGLKRKFKKAKKA